MTEQRESFGRALGRSLIRDTRSQPGVGAGFSGALCRGEDPDLFFGPPGMESRTERQRREADAKALCRQCPEMMACRSYALEQAELYGVWGGLGEQERRTHLVRLGRVSLSG
jgi:hypothetical protein